MTTARFEYRTACAVAELLNGLRAYPSQRYDARHENRDHDPDASYVALRRTISEFVIFERNAYGDRHGGPLSEAVVAWARGAGLSLVRDPNRYNVWSLPQHVTGTCTVSVSAAAPEANTPPKATPEGFAEADAALRDAGVPVATDLTYIRMRAVLAQSLDKAAGRVAEDLLARQVREALATWYEDKGMRSVADKLRGRSLTERERAGLAKAVAAARETT